MAWGTRGAWACARHVGATVADLVLVTPVRHLLLHGPALLGCWRGLPLHDVCAGLSGSPSDHWVHHAQECAALVDRHAWAVAVPLYVGAYFALLALAARHTAGRMFL